MRAKGAFAAMLVLQGPAGVGACSDCPVPGHSRSKFVPLLMQVNVMGTPSEPDKAVTLPEPVTVLLPG